MSCIELRYNKQGKTNIIKLESQSDIQMSDWDILVSFLTTGVLPEGISIYGASVSQEQLFDYLWDQLNTIRGESPIETYMLFDRSKAFRTREDVINKVIGNRDIASTMYNSYETDLFSQNALYVAGWGAKKWYGFTSQRPLLITGISELSPNFTDDILFNTYYNIRNGSQHEKNVIEHLYQKLNPNGGDLDIYSKLTWLANNELRTLVDALYVPQYIDRDRATIRKGLKENFSEYVGALIKYNKEMYFISKKGPEKSVIGINVETGVETEIPISSISSIYEQFTVSFNNKTYYLIDKKWYTKSKKNYKPVDIQLSTSLFDKFFGIIENDFESINVYNKENPIYLNSNVPGTSSDVKTFLPIGSYVRTSTGYFTKDVDGEFRNGDEVLSDDSIIYKIFFNRKDNTPQIFNPGDIVYGHPAIGKTFSIRDGKYKDMFIDWDDEFNEKRDRWIEQQSGTKKGTQEFKQARNEYLINYENHPEYIEFLTSEWERVKTKAKTEGKVLIASPAILVKYFEKDFTKAIMLKTEDFVSRNVARNANDEENSRLWKEGIDKILYASSLPIITLQSGQYLEDIIINNNIANVELIKSLLPIYEEKYYLNKQDAYIILNRLQSSINFTQYIIQEGLDYGFLTDAGKQLFSTSFNKSKFKEGTKKVYMRNGSMGTEIVIEITSPKTGHDAQFILNLGSKNPIWRIYQRGNETIFPTDKNYNELLNRFIPDELLNVEELIKMDDSHSFNDLGFTSTKLEDYMETVFNVYMQGNGTKYNQKQIEKILGSNIEIPFENIRFNYDYSGFRVRMTNGIPYMDIGLKKLEQTPENIRQMYLAATLLKELNNGMKLPAIPDLTVNNFWHMLTDYTYENTTANLNGKKIEISDELRNAFEFILKQVPEITGTEWETSIKENIEDLAQNWTMGDNELDTFIDELISKGLFITMCTV